MLFIYLFYLFIYLLFLSLKTISLQNIRYTSFMSASENDHSNFRISNLSLPTGTLLWSKEGSTKVIYSYFITNYIQFKVTFP